MAKKSATVVLQTEVNNEDDWQKILKREGLLVVDVYSDWSGPCTAMVSSLKKVKMEVGGDSVSYAVAKNDSIGDLERFRGRSEPVWMFVQDGMMVNLMFGAHCPRLVRLLIEEIRRVQRNEQPKWAVPLGKRGPEEQKRWEAVEEQRLVHGKPHRSRKEAARTAKHEAMMYQMAFELCEETALLLFPWVFKDEEGKERDKESSPAYTELVHDLFQQCFDVVEEVEVQLTEDVIKEMFDESNVDVSEELVSGLTDGKCLIMRLKSRPPHPDWPIPYPAVCPEEDKRKCPVRAIDDVEQYLLEIIRNEPPPLLPKAGTSTVPTRRSYDDTFVNRHVYVHQPDTEVVGDVELSYPAVWVPPQARSKVHFFQTIFPRYMATSHRYEESPPAGRKCCFKYGSHRIKEVRDALAAFGTFVISFGVFELDDPPVAKRIASSLEDFEQKVKLRTGAEIFVVVIEHANEETFLAFAGIEPYYVSDSEEEALAQMELYFPKGAVDEVPTAMTKQDSEDEYEEDEEDEEDEEEEEEVETEEIDFFRI